MNQNSYSLTNPQKSILVTEQYYKGTAINTICGYVCISDVVNFDFLKKAINEMIKVNDSMRLKFIEKNNSCIQYVQEYTPFDFDTIYLSSKEEMKNATLKVANTPFNIADSLFNFILFKFSNGSGGFIVSIHHLISDSWTLGLIVKEIMKNYSDLLNNTYEEQIKPSYLNYIQAENDYKNSDKFAKDKKYWDDIFQTIPEVASIPLIKNNQTDSISCAGTRETFILSKKDLTEIKNFCDKYKVSVYNFFMAVYSLYISRVSNLDDFVIGTPILNRTNFEQKQTMGMFISVAPLRIGIDETASFVDFSKKIATDTVSLFRHQKYSYQSILEDVRKKDSSIPNLYNIVLSYQITKTIEKSNQVNYSTDWMFNGNVSDELQIHLFDLNDAESMTVAYDYKSELFSSQEIDNLHIRILNMIHQVISNESILLKEIEIVTPEEKHQILYDFNNTRVDYPRDKTIVNLFEEQVEKTPDNIAVVFENQKFTYKQLNEKANQLARYLKSLNIQDNDKIAILLPRSYELILSMLAIKKANCAYLLIEPSLPIDRINYMLENAEVALVITTSKLDYDSFHSVLIENVPFNSFSTLNLDLEYLPENYLSIVYTSGSTGKPKGILVKNCSITNLVLGYCHSMQAQNLSNFLSICSVSFDMFAAEVWIPLSLGKKLILANQEECSNPILMSEIINKYSIDFMLITPSRMELLLTDDIISKCLLNLKAIQLGGEVLESNFYNKLLNYTNSKIYNGYGPSETTSCATCKLITSDNNINIGTPLPNVQVYICNKLGMLCPPNIVGELCIAGDGVSYGYVNQPDLTNNHFIKNPYGNGLLYKTGDLATFLSNGEIQFIGRLDSQVKINGLRIELEEINQVIR